jgi:hypothetical protein
MAPGLMLGKAHLNDLPFNPDRHCHEMLAAGASRRVQFLPIFQMTEIPKTTDYQCPVCHGRGRVPGRLPGRRRLCDECHGTGRVTPIRRQQLLAKHNAKERA